jgi:nanoRNase/pAp phosphatase (c-di-AMP/oligoRNAs hydrolase)
VTYALWPDSAYSVVLSRSASKCKISIGYNPWSPVARKHNIAAICERHGGGGHPVVGAISLTADDVKKAQELTRTIAEELAT